MYHGPCLQFLDQAVRWAEDLGLQVLLDLHGNPGGESGEPPCGRRCWHWHWQWWRIEESLEVLAVVCARYKSFPCITGIQVCNEPAQSVPIDVLCDFYLRAVRVVRASGMGPESVAVVLPVFPAERLSQVVDNWRNLTGFNAEVDNVA